MVKEEVLSKIVSAKEKGITLNELKNSFMPNDLKKMINELESEGKIFDIKNNNIFQ